MVNISTLVSIVAPLAGSVDRNADGHACLVCLFPVAPLAGSVDRNRLPDRQLQQDRQVAPLAGSVDRNSSWVMSTRFLPVAPLAGSVDRNNQAGNAPFQFVGRSPRGERG